MERRTQRYTDDSDKKEQHRITRLSKNKILYDDVNNLIGVEDISSLDTQTKIDLSKLSDYENKREEYQKIKDYKDILPIEDVKEKAQPKISEEKVYDINSILEEAKKNRVKYDELEKKRKLRENDYVKIADINDKDSYKKQSHSEIDEKELTDLINTITSHNLLQDIKNAEESLEKSNDSDDEEIFSELIATNVDLNLEEGIAEEFTKQNELSKIDNSFYTQSMDLSDQDFEFSEEFERDRKLKIKIIIVIAIIILIVAVVGFVIFKKKGII